MKNFIKDLKQKQQIMIDEGYQVSFLRTFFSDGTSANALYRMTVCLMRYRISPLAIITLWLNRVINGCVIGAGAKFEPGFVIMHPVGVVINSKVTGGHSIVVESGVVIGDEKGQAPVLGENIFIGAGAKIIGGVTIGNNVKIGANAVVVKDVPDNVTVVGIPAKVVSKG
ncbi:serine O-acetyltransferase [Thalassotalea castellviae]|uniref:Serine acetyltransferase n=1 Tax=Thalassotalea castellviae TaxID=3075612 RepID=A0ABU3A0W0_9GAMM|nr:serine acetyltransferase [Thalassotalea sp. W431]MDT0603814.1 serine acetyltransferase [Thalassotalea sp. W431]